VIAFLIGHNAGLKTGLEQADKVVQAFNNNQALVQLVKSVGESVPGPVVEKLLGVLTIMQKMITDPTAQQLTKDLTTAVDEATGRTPAETVAVG
jgi:hypothetical protein